jgi:hypothetical protein
MTPERATQLKDIVEHFHGTTPADEEVIAYCTEKGFEAIDAGTLEDWTFQYDVDTLRNETLPMACKVISEWTPPSGFDSPDVQRAAFKALERSLLAIFEATGARFDVATSALESLAQIGGIFKSASMLATDKKVAIANTFIIQHFGCDPNKVPVGSYAQLCKDLAEKK